MADYSNTPLIKKLGIKENMHVCFLNVPENYEELLLPIPKSLNISNTLSAKYDFIHFFTRSYETLKETFPLLKNHLNKTGLLWVSWPKSSCSFSSTDLTDNTVRNVGLENGLVDVKIAAVDENWSAIKFVYRLKDRAKI